MRQRLIGWARGVCFPLQGDGHAVRGRVGRRRRAQAETIAAVGRRWAVDRAGGDGVTGVEGVGARLQVAAGQRAGFDGDPRRGRDRRRQRVERVIGPGEHNRRPGDGRGRVGGVERHHRPVAQQERHRWPALDEAPVEVDGRLRRRGPRGVG